MLLSTGLASGPSSTSRRLGFVSVHSCYCGRATNSPKDLRKHAAIHGGVEPAEPLTPFDPRSHGITCSTWLNRTMWMAQRKINPGDANITASLVDHFASGGGHMSVPNLFPQTGLGKTRGGGGGGGGGGNGGGGGGNDAPKGCGKGMIVPQPPPHLRLGACERCIVFPTNNCG